MKLLVTGGSGLMGKTLQPLWPADWTVAAPTREELDVTKRESIKAAVKKYAPEVVLHLAAFTDVAAAEYRKKLAFTTNVYGTKELALRSPLFIYLSTEYVFDGERGGYHEGAIPNPVNFYALTKLLGEYSARAARRYCVIRTLFKPRPYEHPMVPTDMWTSGDYVDVIAKKLIVALAHAQDLPKTLHIGTGRKSLLELARQTRKDVAAGSRLSLPVRLPRDTSLDTLQWDMLKWEVKE
ncbi:sugar nucleotide-binding protein [Candidatus Collierbacteria bacterium]|nr:sugar nucleotide-binding protein [Candidatus Collierbacteria bacterium]